MTQNTRPPPEQDIVCTLVTHRDKKNRYVVEVPLALRNEVSDGQQFLAMNRDIVPRDMLAELDAMEVGAAIADDFFCRMQTSMMIDELIKDGLWEEDETGEGVRPTAKGIAHAEALPAHEFHHRTPSWWARNYRIAADIVSHTLATPTCEGWDATDTAALTRVLEILEGEEHEYRKSVRRLEQEARQKQSTEEDDDAKKIDKSR
jgi:hypothetical protein